VCEITTSLQCQHTYVPSNVVTQCCDA
jgi:hypothetical protein